ncbi:hypothetical protein [Acetivibrio mesophilus]|uniref:Uncharacterized protein n=1 Tax=Acetivibrio mesophilus TaxID=2487273 RepID=A0A4Q0I456_9FIRM|nr:hypothetical protein [Acetivibrio mesophilus]ODM26595.1 hypothetical protein A7W90_10385 [Clostridium sp. Bc-iso-3]RXE57682.1 hypothetical protein EFD62_16265 [Acetivibrio mesophilus]HHV28922.1 hypothetical protein [Clostridium sp.]
MAQFCTCGSLIINDSCTNKNCSNRAASKPSSAGKRTAKTAKAAKADTSAKSTRTRRASKCITYNLYDKKAEES